ncbi:MAG: hypothetical protein AMXMBFR57_20060 [Acidimicrobiia bacterium]
MQVTFSVECVAVRDLGFARATDTEIFAAARIAAAVVMTKDSDFVDLVRRLGPPPQVVLVTCGNTSNVRLRELIPKAWPAIATMLEQGEPLVELGDAE